jgi:hypothetical protein
MWRDGEGKGAARRDHQIELDLAGKLTLFTPMIGPLKSGMPWMRELAAACADASRFSDSLRA